MRDLAKRLSAIDRSETVAIADGASRLRQDGAAVVDLSAGRPAEHTPAYICEAAVAALRTGVTHQTMSSGSPELRQAAAAKLARENGIDADPATEVVATLGVKHGLLLALLATVNPGDEVLVEDPCFVSYQPLIRIAGGVPVPVALRPELGFRWTLDDLAAAVTARTRVMLFNSPHNPTGTVHTDADLDVVAGIARAHDLTVITDEVYERVTWGGRHHVSLATRPGMRERTVTVMGLTKTFSMGGWRIGFLHAPAPLVDAMVVLQQHLITCASSIGQVAATRALATAPPHEVRALWADWERRSVHVARELDALPGVACGIPEGGFYAWPDIRETGWDDLELATTLLEQHHVAVVPGSAFGRAGRGRLRLTCVRSWPDLERAIGAIGRVLAREATGNRQQAIGLSQGAGQRQ